MTSTKRIAKELMDLNSTPIESLQLQADELSCWTATLKAPVESAYRGGTFKLTLTYPNEFPFKPPTVKFATKIFHPNVDEEGNLCLAVLKSENWKPATKIRSVLNAIISLLVEPNPDDPLDTDIAELYKTNQSAFQVKAQEYVTRYAK
ncbi:ubiquitin-conjugating enzyme/RWD-like protein [Globomyces pollinis-pini]|nr:ubiquitin-conjugating enzyme/RWD-like protein [Globomyces pollinis-pini]